jgi:tetratricopeptide (TPR) repeat protein
MIRICAFSYICVFAYTNARADEKIVPSPLWDDVLHPDRLRCAQMTAELRREFDGARTAPDRARVTQAVEHGARRCPRSLELQALYGETLIAAGPDFIAQARVALERARQLAPAGEDKDPRLAFHLGFVRAIGGDFAGSLREYLRAQSLGGLPRHEDWLLSYDLGDTYMALGRLGEAIESYRRATRLASSEPMPRMALAVALDRDQQLEKSRAELQVGLTLDPQLRRLQSGDYVFVPRDEIHYYLALVAFARNRPADARRELEAFLAALPESPYAPRAREHLQSQN